MRSYLCARDQSNYLLQFKQSFLIDPSASFEYCENPKTDSWKEGTDCCSWDGVTCDSESGNVIGLDLACSMLYGTLHSNSTLFSLHHLRKLDLSYNDFNLSQISSRFGHFSNLTHLNLNYSAFTGLVPSQISQLSNLVSLDLSLNSELTLEPIPFNKLVQNLTKLRELHLREVDMSLVAPSFLMNLSSPLSSLQLMDCRLQGEFPIFNQESLRVLKLGSNNKLTGEISSSACKLTALQVFDLSNNSLSGFIPQCLGSFSNSLSVLHLGMNDLEGTILSGFSVGSNLGYLNLNGNELEGEIPPSIINCTQLEVLDLGFNKIEGKFPYFLDKLQELKVLVLKSNKLHGFVKGPTTNYAFSKLRIFDISRNNFSGPLPTGYFNGLEAMKTLDKNRVYMKLSDISYDYSVQLTWKGVEIEFVKIGSTLASIDFSDNSFIGEIPGSIAELNALRQLNFSHNSLTGYIQPSLGNLANLESLDLSSNLLTGRIPVQLSDLTFLSVLNLSHNQLEGPIPQGKQFSTFNKNSFEGNLGLCGFQISKGCNSGETRPPPPPSDSEEGDDSSPFGDGFGWKSAGMGYGCGFVFGVTVVYIVFRTRKPAWFVRMVEVDWNLKAKGRKKNARRNGARKPNR
ncbi:Cf-4/9 disease resistance family protein [Salix suchowensis]|nr:Cf-4/9 disease resistance family protein [Salix suchowensis]